MSLAASADGYYGWQVRVMTLTANLHGNYGWQVRVTTLAANPDGNYGCQVRVMTFTANPDGYKLGDYFLIKSDNNMQFLSSWERLVHN